MFAVKDYNNNNFSILALKPNGELWLQPPGTQVANSLSNAAIVAMSITANGYIKYASGLIIQWATTEDIYTANTQYNIYLPISFTDTMSYIYTVTHNIYRLEYLNERYKIISSTRASKNALSFMVSKTCESECAIHAICIGR